MSLVISYSVLLQSPWVNRSVAAVISCYWFVIVAAVIVLWLGGIVSVVCSIVLSKRDNLIGACGVSRVNCRGPRVKCRGSEKLNFYCFLVFRKNK